MSASLFAGIIVFATTFSTQVFASAKVSFNPRSHSLNVSSHIYFYGPAATPDLVKAATNEINLYWNGGSHLVQAFMTLQTRIQNNLQVFKMDVTSEIVTEAQAAALMHKPHSHDMTFIRLLQGNAANGDRSYMDRICSDTGTWYASDDLGNSTTAAHEFGHGMCLEHPESEDLRGKGQPPVMAPRGTIVDSQYQWDPNAEAGAVGGTLSPYKRRVIQNDIDRLNLPQLQFNENGIAFLYTPKRKGDKRVY